MTDTSAMAVCAFLAAVYALNLFYDWTERRRVSRCEGCRQLRWQVELLNSELESLRSDRNGYR